MKFSAFVKRHSAIDRLWRERQQLGGMISGVKFVLAHGSLNAGLYATTEDLDPPAVSTLQLNPSIQVEMIGAPAVAYGALDPAELDVGSTITVMLGNADAPDLAADAPPRDIPTEAVESLKDLSDFIKTGEVKPGAKVSRRGRKPKAE